MEYFVIIDYILSGGWETELRAGMDLVEEYGAKGWEIEKELYWNNGRNKVGNRCNKCG